ncbi:MAG: hypothetical protein HP049_01290 [Clostridiales bacterium]|nr:hypothetical protein [Clostridiales bacterium]
MGELFHNSYVRSQGNKGTRPLKEALRMRPSAARLRLRALPFLRSLCAKPNAVLQPPVFSDARAGKKRRAAGAAGPLAAGRLGKARFSKPPIGVFAGNTDFFACGRVLKFHKVKNAFALAICVCGCYNKDAAPVGRGKALRLLRAAAPRKIK